MNKISLFISLLFFTNISFGQIKKIDSLSQQTHPKFKYSSLVIPTTLIAFGFIGLESHDIKSINNSTSNELKEHIDDQFTIDDISQYSPFVSIYALNALGIKGLHNFKDQTIILTSAYLVMGATVNVIKETANVERPDRSSLNSFPSGHTATAFMGAEFLYQEYKDVSVWYGISGYLVATGTGFFRMYNNRHWLTDIAAGAGIGILSTKFAYWIYPTLKRTFFKDKNEQYGLIMPFYNGEEFGIGFSMMF